MGHKYYAVAKGLNPGIYESWHYGAFEQVHRFPAARFRRFSTYEDAARWIRQFNNPNLSVFSVFTKEQLARVGCATIVMMQPHGKGMGDIVLIGCNIYDVDNKELATSRGLAEFWTPELEAAGVPVVEANLLHGAELCFDEDDYML
ncbi:RNase H1/viroplasmin domain-containing protein (plasmid) [Pseudomonas silesiensis]|uniref:RNase H1/viroplasmin domain-containing protein n=1 Tax=Pseudomonas silesiensis TaxID=1853130 RepID=UPI0030CB9354